MRNMTETQLTDVVVERYASTPDARLRYLLQTLIVALHDYVREARLTETEWMEAIQFLTRTGQMCDDKRQEMILLSDNLGISALVNLVSAGAPEGATETTVVGPFYVPNSPQREWGETILLRETDEPSLIVRGRVVDCQGAPIPDAGIEVWQTDSNGMYDIQDPTQAVDNLRGHYRTNAKGEFLIRTIRPTSYPIPTDGPVGELLEATARHPWRPAHIHAIVTAPGHRPLVTHLFDAEDAYLDSDVVFAVKESLIRNYAQNSSEEDAARFGVSAPFWELETDFILAAQD
ncbi:dioxygenase [Sphingobium sp. 15-1]|uniref:dioxygenase family protein n=1 Tax=Sphingobium sp. 15-1 TaxID=2729616 RepID=UPI00159C305A|nr:dioxygenase [Sphingobium sp. 15-1]